MSEDGADHLCKYGEITNPADAFVLVRWFSGAILESYQDRFGQPILVDVDVTVRSVDAGSGQTTEQSKEC